MLGKRAIITGASYGIGEALAKKFAQNGIEVILIARTEKKLSQVAQEIESKGGKAYIFSADLVRVDLEKLYYEISEKLSPDILVNNAGFGSIGSFHELDTQREVEMVELNVRVLLELTSYFLRDRISKGQGGTIINISSLAGFFPIPNMATYAATKAFVLSFSEAIRREVEDLGIKVITICPGGIKTEFQKRAGVPEDIYSMQRYMNVDEAVDLMWKAVLKGVSPYVPGTLNSIYGFVVRHIPIPIITKLAKLFMNARIKKQKQKNKDAEK